MDVSFVLVESEEAQNIGAAARAMNTMGHGDLRLVRPRADHLGEKARLLAYGSEHILEAAHVYDTLSAAVQDVDMTCATTARHRMQKYQYVSVRELPGVLRSKEDWVQRVALVFGGERSGLKTADIEACDLITTIPQQGLHPSLNLAQAVMVYSFIFSEARTAVHIRDQRRNSQSMPSEEYANLKVALSRLMRRIGVSDRYQGYVMKSLALLGYEDLYLIHTLRAQVERALDGVIQSASYDAHDGNADGDAYHDRSSLL